MRRFKGASPLRLRRGGVIVQVGVMSTIILGMGALAIDVGAMYTTQTELQAAADSAALAAAQRLMGDDGGAAPVDVARDAAVEYAGLNKVDGSYAGLAAGSDVEFGRAQVGSNGRWQFTPVSGGFDCVRVTVRKSADSPNGALAMTFANIFGVAQKDLWARATAMLIPRDIAVVCDLSGSMGDDSNAIKVTRTDGGYTNARDIWAALNGPESPRPYEPAPETSSPYAGDTGPTFGLLNTWGSPLLPGYNGASDAGLVFIQKTKNVSGAALTKLTSSLTSRGYTSAERAALLTGVTSSGNDSNSSRWQNRAGVCLNLATWRSGKAGSVQGSGGDGDNLVEDSEVSWVAKPSFAVNWVWKDFIDFPQTTHFPSGSSGFRYRYGLKTFVDFLLVERRSYNETNVMWQTPEQPLRAVKDAVQVLSNTIVALDSPDHMSLESFATTAVHEVNLSEDMQAVPTRLYQRQSAHFNDTTNIGGGIVKGINELESPRARDAAKKIIVLLSDGVPNIDENGNYDGGGGPGRAYALAMADVAADKNIAIYAVSVGYGADRPLMQAIANATYGQEFYAQGSPDEYTEQLEDIFRSLGGRRPVALIQ